jgi:hypothetical protein
MAGLARSFGWDMQDGRCKRETAIMAGAADVRRLCVIYDADIGKNRRAMASFALIGCRRMVFRFSRRYRPVMTSVAKPGRVLEPARDMTGFTGDLRVTVC